MSITQSGSEKASEALTLRDYFAAKAMQGYVSCNEEITWSFSEIANDAYKQADAMLAARGKA